MVGRSGSAGPLEIRDGIAQVKAFLEAHGSSRFEDPWQEQQESYCDSDGRRGATPRTVNRAGFRRRDALGNWRYFIFPEIWRAEVCKGYDAGAIAKAMIERGWIERGDGKNLTKRERVPGRRLATPLLYQRRFLRRGRVVSVDIASLFDDLRVPLPQIWSEWSERSENQANSLGYAFRLGPEQVGTVGTSLAKGQQGADRKSLDGQEVSLGPEHAGQPWANDPAEFCNWSRRPLPDENRRSDPPEAESWREPPELTPMPWAERSDVITVVEDLADQGVRVCQIVRELG
jgi:hypothetical protein